MKDLTHLTSGRALKVPPFLMAKKRSDHLLQQITQQATNSRGETFRVFSKIFQNESVSLQNQGAFALNFRRQILKIGVESLLSIA